MYFLRCLLVIKTVITRAFKVWVIMTQTLDVEQKPYTQFCTQWKKRRSIELRMLASNTAGSFKVTHCRISTSCNVRGVPVYDIKPDTSIVTFREKFNYLRHCFICFTNKSDRPTMTYCVKTLNGDCFVPIRYSVRLYWFCRLCCYLDYYKRSILIGRSHDLQ